jgi:hypothetical protein
VLKNLKNGGSPITTSTWRRATGEPRSAWRPNPPDTTYACVCNGGSAYTDGAKEEKLVSAAHHHAARYVREKGRVLVSEAGLQYHTDADIEALAKAIALR